MVTGVLDDVGDSLGKNIQATYGYYRQPNGWVTASPITRLELLKYTEEGWQYLEAYGAFDMTPYGVTHIFEGLFMFGGAKELCADQILQTGLYFDPPLVPRCKQHLTQFHRAHKAACWRGATKVEFPQLATIPKELIGPFPCEFCSRKMATQEGRRQHQQVAHTTPLNNIELGRTLGNTMAAALGSNRAATAAPADDTEASLRKRVAELEAQVANKGVETCGCGASYKPGGKTFHQRSRKHKDWASEAGG